jgi:ketosteroid isomerase-like protein
MLILVVVVAVCGAILLEPLGISAAAAHDSMAGENSLERQIVAQEQNGLEALKNGDLGRFGSLTAEEAVFVDEQGPATKAQVLKNVAGFKLTEYSMDDVKFVALSKNTGLISYKSTEKGVSHGEEFATQVYVSSVWTKRGGKWVCLFSQETRVRQAVPAK